MNTIKETDLSLTRDSFYPRAYHNFIYVVIFMPCIFYTFLHSMHFMFIHVSEMYKRSLILLVKFHKSEVTYHKLIFGNFI